MVRCYDDPADYCLFSNVDDEMIAERCTIDEALQLCVPVVSQQQGIEEQKQAQKKSRRQKINVFLVLVFALIFILLRLIMRK